MKTRSLVHIALGALLIWGCAKPPPPAAPAPPPAEPEAPPPPPPKCEVLEDKCAAKDDDRVTIEPTHWKITPPAGWTFSRNAKEPLAVTKAAVLAVEGREVKDPKKPPRDEATAALLTKLGVTFPKAKGKLTFPKKADKTLSVAKLTVSLYQFDGATRDGKKGPLLVFTTPVTDGAIVVGAGFVAEDDDTNADAAILKAIESLSSEAASAAPSPAPATPAAPAEAPKS